MFTVKGTMHTAIQNSQKPQQRSTKLKYHFFKHHRHSALCEFSLSDSNCKPTGSRGEQRCTAAPDAHKNGILSGMLLPIKWEKVWLLIVFPFFFLFFRFLHPFQRGSSFLEITFWFSSLNSSRVTLSMYTNSRKCNLTPLTHGSQCTFSRNYSFLLPSFLT